ncbi:NAD(P)H-dependent oxidoreductase [uncultured Pelagimonas sp.]|uniref:NAD(P)H-dependent oxidoreductase n=1 Tax=uncultured Pelagimonas sp. TaxID=1618102 RepID=UPI002629D9CA|nr:NAD(P)H-dependent oxidoreductase [uncultured Pelagimonas sp.]
MPRKIFVFDAHPVADTLNAHMAQTYLAAAQATGHDLRHQSLSQMAFDPDFGQTHYRHTKALEPDLEAFMQALEWSDHLVMTMPMWWGSYPAKTKALLDRSLMAGRAFDTRNPNIIGLPAPMLSGRSARVIITSDTPRIFQRLAYGDAFQKQIKGQVTGFVGIKPTRFTWLAPAGTPKPGVVEKWAAKVETLGRKGM